jgi:hypothetical protein
MIAAAVKRERREDFEEQRKEGEGSNKQQALVGQKHSRGFQAAAQGLAWVGQENNVESRGCAAYRGIVSLD